MTRQRTSAEIEAGARALYQNRSQTRWAWEELEPKQREHFLAVAQDTLAAADAAAAPAVGVTVDELREALVALIQAAFEHGLERGFAEYRDSGDRLTAAAAKNKQARDRVFALLTAQPELGTHDDAGHIVIPAKPEGWKP